MQRLATVLRDIARGGLAGLLAGVLVGGVGGRIVMSALAVLNPDAAGARTENGEEIGQFTVQGTLALITIGGLGAGALRAVVWVIVSPWVPGTRRRRALLMVPIAVALGTFILVESTNSDFLLLKPIPVVLALLLGLVALNGAAIAWLDDALEHRLPRPGPRPVRALVAYGIVAVLGVPLFLLTLQAFFSPEFASSARPAGVGIALVVVGVATAMAWVLRLRNDAPVVPPALALAGRLGLVAAVALGGFHVALELSRILALA
jgi:hypothetical protein